ncbi:MAG: hypothetical protein IT445_10340 [Phycisphaeraceae bacterium]|nr:hypothetical protein [Phycisphaeraceae bacterium]
MMITTHTMMHTLRNLCLLFVLLTGPHNLFAIVIVPRTTPVLEGTATTIAPESWRSVAWVKSIWTLTDTNRYRSWEEHAAWGNAESWYITHPRIAWFNNQLFATFTESNQPHGEGDAVIHVMVSGDDGQNWSTAAHYEVENGFKNTHFSITSDDRLMLTGYHVDSNRMMASFSANGSTWSPLTQFTTPDGQGPGIMFQLAWHDSKAYGINRQGLPWMSENGLDYEPILVSSPADGTVGGNEIASTFLGDQWIAFQRSGRIASSESPYANWDLNDANYRETRQYGGPALITLPDGQVVAGSREWELGGYEQPAAVFRYDDGILEPLNAFNSGATMTGYPGLAWHNGYLYVSFLRDLPGDEYGSGQFVLAKMAWPVDLHPGDANYDDVVNLSDLQILGDHWRSSGVTWYEGDFTSDGTVGLADLQIIGDNWGWGNMSDLSFLEANHLAGRVAPEPATALILGPGTLLSLRRSKCLRTMVRQDAKNDASGWTRYCH